MAQFTGGAGAGTLVINSWEAQNDAQNNRSLIHFEMYMNCSNGQSWTANSVGFSANVAGNQYGGTWTFDFRRTQSVLIFAVDVWVQHDFNGNLGASVSGNTGSTGTSIAAAAAGGTFGTNKIYPGTPRNFRVSGISSSSVSLVWDDPGFGSGVNKYIAQSSISSDFSRLVAQQDIGSGGRSVSWGSLAPNTRYYFRLLAQNDANGPWTNSQAVTYVAPPGQPTNVVGSKVTPTGFQLDWLAPSNNGGEAPTGYDAQVSLASDFSNPVTKSVTGTTAWMGDTLLPGNQYYTRVRAKNSAGVGAWCPPGGIMTLPSTPPTMTVLPQPSGRSVTVSLTPPSGISNVNQYSVVATDTTTGTARTTAFTTNGGTIAGLTPGRTYAFTATYTVGAYTSPASAPQNVTMPAPSTSPGAYFDGSSTGTADQKYAWTGTSGQSSSQALGFQVQGWSATPTSTAFTRVTGGLFGTFAGRLLMLADAVAGKGSWNVYTNTLSQCEGTTQYSFSIYVQTTQPASLAARVKFYDSNDPVNGSVIGDATGVGVLVSPGDGWVRLDVVTTSPDNGPGKVWAQLLVTDGIVGASDFGTTYAWTGSRGSSTSIELVNGSERYRNQVVNSGPIQSATNGIENHTASAISLVSDATLPGPADLAYDIDNTSGTPGTIYAGRTVQNFAPATGGAGVQWWARAWFEHQFTVPGARRLSLYLRFLDASKVAIATTAVNKDLIPLGTFRNWTGTPYASASMEYAGTSSRMNYAQNPHGLQGGNALPWTPSGYGTGGAGGVTSIATGAPDGGAYAQQTWTTAATGGGASLLHPTFQVPANAADRSIVVSIWVMSNQATAFSIPATVGSVSTTAADVTGVPVGTWTQLSRVLTIPASTTPTSVQLGARISNLAGTAVGLQLNATMLLVEEGTVVKSFFDGTTLTTIQGAQRGYLGASQTSGSYEVGTDGVRRVNMNKDPYALNAAGWGVSGSNTVGRMQQQSTLGESRTGLRPSVKQTVQSVPTGGNNNGIKCPAEPVRLVAGQKVTWSFWVKPPRDTTITMYADAQDAVTGSYAAIAPSGGQNVFQLPANQWTKVSGTGIASKDLVVTSGFGGYAIGNSQVGDVFFYDGFLIEYGSTVGTYFDGSMTDASVVLPTGIPDPTPFELVVNANAPANANSVIALYVGDSVLGNDPTDHFRVSNLGLFRTDDTSAPAWFDGDGSATQRWTPMLSGGAVVMDGAMLMLNHKRDYFDGSFPDTLWADYAWQGTPHASVSQMTPLNPPTVDLLSDPDVSLLPQAPQPPQLVDDGIIEVGVWRRYWAVVPVEEISTYLDLIPSIVLTTGQLEVRQVRIRYWANPDGLTPNQFDDGAADYIAEQIISYIPANTVMMLDGLSERVWASVLDSDRISGDHLLYGSDGGPATWPALSCGVGYLISFDTPLDSPAGNLQTDVSLTRRM